jgi:uncharacterized PurR-regulated membrane protein YhhQ (DUF165 family)
MSAAAADGWRWPREHKMQTMRHQRIVKLSTCSGIVWSFIAFLLCYPAFGVMTWGGIVVAPFIAVAMGLASSLFPPTEIRRAVFSLFGLYIAAALFGLGMGTLDLVMGPNSGPGWQRDAVAVVLQAMLATLWGLTSTGSLIVLWPLCYANVELLSGAWLEAKRQQPA